MADGPIGTSLSNTRPITFPSIWEIILWGSQVLDLEMGTKLGNGRDWGRGPGPPTVGSPDNPQFFHFLSLGV